MRKLNTEEIVRVTAEEFREAEKMPLVVVLDNVRSLYNVGSVFRTADAYRVERVVLCGITATPPDAEIHKTALGAEFTVDWVHYKDTTEAVGCLKAEGYHVYAVEQTEGSVMLGDFHAEEGGRYAVILGNEVKGVKQEERDRKKDEILSFCSIPLMRFRTDGSREKEALEEFLEKRIACR